ncbi:MAG: hypothetical protein LBP62_06670 [Clostridiales bacterium]|jgi:hypothetical protein|nr:hypothetical protein [Clostridiales bacterium]
MILSDEAKKFLDESPYDFQELIDKDDVTGILDLLNDITIEHMDEEYYPTPYGDKAQEVLDEIYYDNRVANAQK